MPRFRDRFAAGRQVVSLLREYAQRADVLVLGLPRGGVPVAFEVGQGLDAPLDVFLVRKLGAPGHEELAIGAVASGGVRVLNRDVLDVLPVPERVIDELTAQELRELEQRERMYRGDRPLPEVRDKTVILVDDGLATGSTMRAAARAARLLGPARLVVAVPVAPAETCSGLAEEVDEVVCLLTPEPFYGVSQWYEDFSPTSDQQVGELLRLARSA
jgi:putative phosphoribosyl transferase